MNQASGYRGQLLVELQRRQRSNSRYSLRSFARDIELSPSFLSNIINGRKGLSLDAAHRLTKKLRYSDVESLAFLELVRMETESSAISQLRTPAPREEITLQLEAFQVLSDWHHYAIRELTRTQGFKNDPKWISKRLGISVKEANEARERLLNLGLVEQDSKGQLKSTSVFITTPTDQPSRALRNHHQQMIRKAEEALEIQDVSRRDITGTTIAIHPKQLETAKKEIQKFRKRLVKILETDEATEVYRLNIQLFSLTENPKAKE